MDELELLVDLHKGGTRQGPGGERETRLAIELAGLKSGKALRVADIGCGSGASALVLAADLDAQVTAVDLFPAFLEKLEVSAADRGLSSRLTTLEASMDQLPFEDGALDAIWSEGAIYNMGFEKGVRAWRSFLKPGGVLAVSELTWFTEQRPEELDAHWGKEYPEVDTASAKLAVLENNGFSVLGYFPLPEHCWMDNYYRPTQKRIPAFLDAHKHSAAAKSIAGMEQAEMALYRKYREFVGYGFYIARRTTNP
ncbi:MAG: methyltransferase domain-containing protein [Pseudomonadota bacterium]